MGVILRTLLAGFGARDVREARNAAEAFEICKDAAPDLALVDFVLEDLDGLEFTRLVRTASDSPNRNLPIIMVTAHAARGRVMEAINAGVNELVVKPVSAQSLYERLRGVIERPRPFVQTKDYYGPCRRRRADAKYRGPWKRADDAEQPAASVKVDG